MNQLRQLYDRLTPRQRLSVAGGVLAMALAILGFVNWQKERDFRPLYTGLAAGDAGAVTARLRERNIEFRLEDGGGAVMVPSNKVAEVRLDLAAAGLPKTGRIGYELFDKANFGVTDFAEQVNYHRAVEGELERSVMALAEVESARVHVTFPKDSVFVESKQPAKASVMIKLKRGRSLARPSVEAVQHLAASAVEGLEPAAVSVIDMQGNLLSRPQSAEASDGERAELLAQHRRKMEGDLLAKVNQTLEPLLGPNGFRAGVSVDLDLASGEASEEVFDPAKSVMVTQQRSEEVSAPQAVGGVPGTQSTLPRPTSRPLGSGSNVSRRTDNVTFQTSRTIRKTSTPQGVVRRLSLSVLVDQRVRWEGTGAKARRMVEPPKPEEIKAIRDVVAGAVGFSISRGDQLIVESLPFDATLKSAPPALVAAPVASAPGWMGMLPENLRSPLALAIMAGVLLAVVLGMALLAFLLLRRRKKKVPVAEETGAAIEGSRPAAALAAAAGAELPTGGSEARLPAAPTKTVEEMLSERESERDRFENQELAKLQAATMSTTKTDILTKHVIEEAKKNPEGIAQVMRNWLQDE